MEFNTENTIAASGDLYRRPRQTNNDDAFASMLDAERLKVQSEAARAEVLSNQPAKKETKNSDDIEFIREHGMKAYVEETHARKMEELREKILEAMGLSEEMLEQMPADKRQAIEKIVAMEVQKRMAAESLTNGSSEQTDASTGQKGVGNVGPFNLLAAQALAGDPGSLVGMMISQQDQIDGTKHDNKDGDNTG